MSNQSDLSLPLQFVVKLAEVFPIALAAFFYASDRAVESNECWKAVHELPHMYNPAANSNVKGNTKFRQWKPFIKSVFLVLYTILASVVPRFFTEVHQILIVNLVTLFLPLAVIIFKADLLSIDEKDSFVKRDPMGRPCLVYKNEHDQAIQYDSVQSSSRRPLPIRSTESEFFMCLLTSFGAVWPWIGQPVCVAIALYSFMKVFICPCMLKSKVSMKNFMFPSVFYAGYTIYIASRISSEPRPIDLIKPLPDGLYGWEGIGISALAFSLPCQFLSMLYRYNSRDKIRHAEFPAIIQDQATTIRIRRLRSCESWDKKERKPYFHCTFMTFITALVCNPVLDLEGIVSLRLDNYLLVASIFAYPLMVIGTLVLAVKRGEWKDFVNYEEDWAAASAPMSEKEKQLAVVDIEAT